MLKISSKKGQALFEMLPMFVIFFMAISGAVAYFHAMRNAVLAQETARNAAFAKIANSGPLVTSPTAANQPLQAGPYDRRPASFTISGVNNNAVVGPQNTCFTVFPGQPVRSENLPSIYGMSSTILETNRAIVYRSGGSQCQ